MDWVIPQDGVDPLLKEIGPTPFHLLRALVREFAAFGRLRRAAL
jgi:hypothetical protein